MASTAHPFHAGNKNFIVIARFERRVAGYAVAVAAAALLLNLLLKVRNHPRRSDALRLFIVTGFHDIADGFRTGSRQDHARPMAYLTVCIAIFIEKA